MSESGGNGTKRSALRSPVSDLVRLAQESLRDDLSPAEQAGLVRFEQAVAQRTRPRRQRRWLLGLGLTAAAAGIVVALTTFRPHGVPLSFTVVNGTVSGGYVRADGEQGTDLHFSDGSTLALDRGTSTRVTDLGPNGSRVLLESGRAHVRITPRPHAKWTIDAGPYSVRVVGTEFDVRWSGNEGMFDVQLHKGSVVVTGPLASRGITMEAGQHLMANVKEGAISLDSATPSAGSSEIGEPGSGAAPEAGGAEATPDAPGSAPLDPAALSRLPLPAPRPARSQPGLSPGAGAAAGALRSWSNRIAGGDFQGVLTAAERRGLENTYRGTSAAELSALADAARYLRRTEVARRALLAERDRFPKSQEAHEAAFFLGGLSEDEPGAESSKAALDWYDHYLTENPRGAYASHALGREMVLIHKLRGVEAARPLAAQYLERFPNGPYAPPARKLIPAP